MRPIPADVQALLKSRKMIGANKPTAQVVVGGSFSYGNDFTTWTDVTIRGVADSNGGFYGESYWGGGHYCRRLDGKMLVVYHSPNGGVNPYSLGETGNRALYRGGGIMLSVVDTEDDLFSTHNSVAANEWLFKTLDYSQDTGDVAKLKKLPNGEILLFIGEKGWNPQNNNDPNYPPKPYKCEAYISRNGLGTDFVKLSTIFEMDLTLQDWIVIPPDYYGNTTTIGTYQLGNPVILPSGRILLPVNHAYYWKWGMSESYAISEVYHVPYIAYSDDMGKTWKNSLIPPDNPVAWNGTKLYTTPVRAVAKFGDDLYTRISYNGYSMPETYKSTDDGVTWQRVYRGRPAPQFSGDYGYGADLWSWGEYDGYNYYLHDTRLYRRPDNEPLPSGEDMFKFGNANDPDLGGTATWEYLSQIPIFNVKLSNRENIYVTESGRFTLSGTDVKGVNYTDSSSRYHVISTGEKPVKFFNPKKISINRSTMMPAASLHITLDNKNGIFSPDNAESEYKSLFFSGVMIEVYQGYGDNVIKTFTGFVDTVEMTSFPHEITLECRDFMKKALDQTITNLTFTNMSVEAIFRNLATRAGFSAVIAEPTGLTLPEKAFSWESYGDAFDYLAELASFEYFCDEEGVLYFQEPKEPTEYVYTFKEGEDIINLGYTIDDTEQYREIIAVAQDGSGADISAKYVHPVPNMVRLLPQKRTQISIAEKVSQAHLQQIVDRMGQVMLTRLRRVKFRCVAVPYLQIGDAIQVIETSSTISDIYRILDIEIEQSNNGFTMELTAYYYQSL